MATPTIGRGQIPVYSPTGATLSITNGLPGATFTGTSFISTDLTTRAPVYAVGVGDILVVPGVGFGFIESVADATHLNLASPWEHASQSSITSGGSPGWYIIRSSVSAFGPVAKAIQDVNAQGTDALPVRSWTIDDGGGRMKLRVAGGVPQIAVGPSGASDADLKVAVSFNPSTGQVIFPSGSAIAGTGGGGGGSGGTGGGGTGGGGTGGGGTGGGGTGGTGAAALNPADRDASITVASGNLAATSGTANYTAGNKNIRGNIAGLPGNYYEAVFSGTVIGGYGVANASQSLGSSYPGDPNSAAWFYSAYAEWPGSGKDDIWVLFGNGDVLGCLYTGATVVFSKNGTVVGTASPPPSGLLYPIISFGAAGCIATVNFGASPFVYAPSGALPWGATGTGGGSTASGTVWNSAAKHANITLSGGGLAATSTVAAVGQGVAWVVRADTAGSPGRYFELVWSGAGPFAYGLSNTSAQLDHYAGDPNGASVFSNGYVEWPGSGYNNNTGVTFGIGDKMGLLQGATDAKFYKNGTLFFTIPTLPTGQLFPTLSMGNLNEKATANFGTSAFANLPAGAVSWNTPAGPGAGSAVTWSTTDKDPTTTLSAGNLRVTSSSPGAMARSTVPGNPGNYFELVWSAGIGDAIGVSNSSLPIFGSAGGLGGTANGVGFYWNGYVGYNNAYTNLGATFGAGDVMGLLVGTSDLKLHKNGTLVGTFSTLPTGRLFACVETFNGDVVTANFGATPFTNPPAGATPWGT